MGNRRGYTLVELILTILALGVVAVLFFVGMKSSRRAAREREAAASLKSLASAEADFRGNDRDGNIIQDFWTRDVAGLYGVVPVGSTERVKLIDISVAVADFAAAGESAPGVTGLAEIDRDKYGVAAPRAGYWFQRMLTDETGAPYRNNTNGEVRADRTISEVDWWNHSKFAFYAFPDSYEDGRNVFFINEGNTIFKRPMNSSVKPGSARPSPAGLKLRYGSEGLVGDQVPEAWPRDEVLKAEHSTID